MRSQGHRHRVGGVPRKGRAGEHDARLAVPQHIELRWNRDRRRAGRRADDAHDRVRDQARKVQIGGLGAGLAQGVGAQLAHEHIAVSALAAHQAVLPQHRVQSISTGTATELVVAGAGKQHVIATAAKQLVIAHASDEGHTGIAVGKGTQVVVAQQVDHLPAALAHLDRVIAVATPHIERDRVEQTRGIERVIALTHVDDDLGDAGKSLVKAQELDVNHAIGHAAEDDAFCRIFGVQVKPVAGTGAHVEREYAALDKAQLGFDRGRAECQRGQPELKELEAHGARQESLAPNIGGQRGLEGQVEKIERPTRNAWNQARVKHHAQRFRGAYLAVAVVAHTRDLTVGIARNGAGLDVIHVGRDGQRDRAAHTRRGHTGDADAAQQARLKLEAELGLFLAAGAGHHLAVLEGGQGPVVDIKAVERVKGIAAGNRFLDAEGVKAEGQVHKGRHTADGAYVYADP